MPVRYQNLTCPSCGRRAFPWHKRRSLWIAAEDCPGGVQVEEADLDMLRAQLPLRSWGA
jgi:hypothetical protein